MKIQNVLDMNAHFGGFNSALLEAGKSVWVMNVVPTSGPNQLLLILERVFLGMYLIKLLLQVKCEPCDDVPPGFKG